MKKLKNYGELKIHLYQKTQMMYNLIVRSLTI